MGVVTTARVTHASPAATYARSPDRNWERDSDMKDLPDKCVPDIATQLIKNNSNINVSVAPTHTLTHTHARTHARTHAHMHARTHAHSLPHSHKHRSGEIKD